MSEIPNEIFQPLEEQKQQVFRLGTVTNLFENGTAQVLFDGETEPSQKQYAFLSTYRPAVDDRVFLAAIGGTYVILGAISHEISQDDPTEGNFVTLQVSESAQIKDLTVKDLIVSGSAYYICPATLQSLTVNNGATINGVFSVDGNIAFDGNIASFGHNRIGFFGKSAINKPTTQRPVRSAQVSVEVRVNDAFDWIDSVAQALANLGLINIQYRNL